MEETKEPYYFRPVCNDVNSIVVHVKDEEEDFWGCGECGNVWFSESDIGKE